MTIKYLSSIFLILLLGLPYSCDIISTTGPCAGGSAFFTVSRIEANLLAPGDTIPAEEVAILIDVTDVAYSGNQRLDMNNSAMNLAMACSPPPPGPKQKIDSISITSTSTSYPLLDSLLEPGSLLNDYFNVELLDSPIKMVSLEEYINKDYPEIQEIHYALYGISFFLRPDTSYIRRDTVMKQSFQVTVHFDEGPSKSGITDLFYMK